MLYSLILACTIDGGIGNNNQIPWNIQEDMKLFKKITTDVNCYVKKNAIIMGRNTWESLPQKPLKDRINIIITSKPSLIQQKNNEIYSFDDFNQALVFCNDNIYVDKVFVIGGKSLYDLCLNDNKFSKKIDCIHLSIIKEKAICDTKIDLKKILKTYRNYNIHEIIFNSKFIYIKLIARTFGL